MQEIRLPVHVFKGSFGPIVALLNEHQVKYGIDQRRSAEISNA